MIGQHTAPINEPGRGSVSPIKLSKLSHKEDYVNHNDNQIFRTYATKYYITAYCLIFSKISGSAKCRKYQSE